AGARWAGAKRAATTWAGAKRAATTWAGAKRAGGVLALAATLVACKSGGGY
ncbi:MAG: hypothetical protein QOC73_20, partial [Actinomycetota bacterium]|nr:hypothetical protein [Actinomycetota bacterium]